MCHILIFSFVNNIAIEWRYLFKHISACRIVVIWKTIIAVITFTYIRGVKVMVFNDTFNNISVISWRSVLLVEETGENHGPVASHWYTFSHNFVSSTPRHYSLTWSRRNFLPADLSITIFYYILWKQKFKQLWSTIPAISTERRTTSNLKSLKLKKTMEFQPWLGTFINK